MSNEIPRKIGTSLLNDTRGAFHFKHNLNLVCHPVRTLVFKRIEIDNMSYFPEGNVWVLI
jgi:hypothetical protein